MCQGPEFNPRFKHAHGFHAPFFGKQVAGMVGGIMSQVKDCFGSLEGWVPYDVEEMDDYFKITVPLPGLSKEDVKISLINGCLNISSKRPKSDEQEKRRAKSDTYCGCGSFPFGARWYSAFWEKDINLDIQLPPTIDENNIKSVMKNGLLKIKIGKKPAKKIDIGSGDNPGNEKLWNPKSE